MGNLGWYQLLTTIAKKVGGPKKLIALIFSVGAAAALPIGTKIGTWKEAHKNKPALTIEPKTYTVTSEYSDTHGLQFKAGDSYRILERDDESVLIERIGDANNPYFVSVSALKAISDFTDEHEEK